MIYLVSNTKFPSDDVVNLGVCKIKFYKFSVELENFDALIIASKNAINALKFNAIKLPPKSQNFAVFAIGDASKKAALEFGFSNIFVAKNSHGDAFGAEICGVLKNKKALLIAPKQSGSNLAEILEKNGVFLRQIIGYENCLKKLEISQKPPQNSTLIFTSPKNVENFVKNFGWKSSYKAVAIGETTAKSLQNFTTPTIAKTQNIAECVRLAKLL